jgi:NAD(P)H dehydrogenase (quinone)
VMEASLDDLEWADGYIFSVPTRFGNMAAQMKQFLDTAGPLWAQGKLANKAVTAMSSAQNPHGGQEATILSLYTVMAHWGAIIVPPGYTDPVVFQAGGNPYGTSTTAVPDGQVPAEVLQAARHQARRLVSIVEKLKA